ncbi:MAG: type II secretion system protein [bacterium]|nr:type II secretion system protein [bacterium]
MKNHGFTLAEVLITLAIIGVVAAISIPSVISNSQQQEFKTGLRKAVSVLNSAITMNMALDGETPYDNANLYGFLMRHMSIMKSTTQLYKEFLVTKGGLEGTSTVWNAAFYTTDGMRFEFRTGGHHTSKLFLYENPDIETCATSHLGYYVNSGESGTLCGGCGSFGLNNNSDNTTKPPCLIMVDVNGDRKPNPNNVSCKNITCAKPYKFSDSDGKKLTDLFTVIITDKEAIPYGVAAQRAMYNSQK